MNENQERKKSTSPFSRSSMQAARKERDQSFARNWDLESLSLENRVEIVDEAIRRKYLSRLADMSCIAIQNLPELEDDLISSIRLYRIGEMVYQKGTPVSDIFTSVFNTMASFPVSLFVLLDSDGIKTSVYLGIRSNEEITQKNRRSPASLGDTLMQSMTGHFPGAKLEQIDRLDTASISTRIEQAQNVASVSISGSLRKESDRDPLTFIQGLDKLIRAMDGQTYTGIILAENQAAENSEILRKNLQEVYTALSPFVKTQFSENSGSSTSAQQSFSSMNGWQKTALLAGLAAPMLGAGIGAATAGTFGMMIGSQVGGMVSSLLGSFAPTKQTSKNSGTSTSSEVENKLVKDLLKKIDEELVTVDQYSTYGMWNTAGYFLSEDASCAEIAANNYRSLMNGEKSGLKVSAVNTWRYRNGWQQTDLENLSHALSRFIHPRFVYGGNTLVDATVPVSGQDLGLHLGLPRVAVPGLPIAEHAEFGKEVHIYQLFGRNMADSPEDRMMLGHIFDLGRITDKSVELQNRSLNMHTFVTGSTGSGKSNTVYQMLAELHQDRIPFLVVEPAKGEYKDVFGHLPDVEVFSTNPNIARMIHLNPFKFPASVHVLEHIDGLVEIFSVCWPMYDAMPAFFKDAILRSYERAGWNLGTSLYEGDPDPETGQPGYPDFKLLCQSLADLINESDYASDIKSNYRGALLTRVKSLTEGLNKYIFTSEQTPYEVLFDHNCILDLSRIKSLETKSLMMGLIVYILNEYRMDQKDGSNKGLRHVTVLEEAHNLLKNTAGTDSSLVGKSVEMITNTIAEIRTYGEGFIIVDQSPSSVDIAAIKNTNTKIVLRTPEANDREAVGRSMGLNQDQMEEIARLPGGVAVVYQNEWVSPVLTLINKADVQEIPYIYDGAQKQLAEIQSQSRKSAGTSETVKAEQDSLHSGEYTEQKNPSGFTDRSQTVNHGNMGSNQNLISVEEARMKLTTMLAIPHHLTAPKDFKEVLDAISVLQLAEKEQNLLGNYISSYFFLGPRFMVEPDQIVEVGRLLISILNLDQMNLTQIIKNGQSEELDNMVEHSLPDLNSRELSVVKNLIASGIGGK